MFKNDDFKFLENLYYTETFGSQQFSTPTMLFATIGSHHYSFCTVSYFSLCSTKFYMISEKGEFKRIYQKCSYAMVYHQTHQQRCPVGGTTTFQSFGGFHMPPEDTQVADQYPHVFKKFWSASEVIDRSTTGFTVLSNIVITPNQTRTTCPEVK